MPAAPELDVLATPVAWAAGDERLLGCNAAFARWLGVSARRLEGLPIAGLDVEDGRLGARIARLPDTGEPSRVRRARLRAPGGGERFADLVLAREAAGLRIEAYPVDE